MIVTTVLLVSLAKNDCIQIQNKSTYNFFKIFLGGMPPDPLEKEHQCFEHYTEHPQ